MAYEQYDRDRVNNASANSFSILTAVNAGFAADATRDAAVLAAINSIVTGDSSVDTSVVVNAVNAVRDEARERFAELHAENVYLKAEVDQLTTALQAGAQAELDKLA